LEHRNQKCNSFKTVLSLSGHKILGTLIATSMHAYTPSSEHSCLLTKFMARLPLFFHSQELNAHSTMNSSPNKAPVCLNQNQIRTQ